MVTKDLYLQPKKKGQKDFLLMANMPAENLKSGLKKEVAYERL